MRPLDWAVMFAWLVFLVSYGLWRGRGSSSNQEFMLASKNMPW
jgi:Na+/proline symporter